MKVRLWPHDAVDEARSIKNYVVGDVIAEADFSPLIYGKLPALQS